MKGIKRRIDLGPAVVSVEWLSETEMRAEAECDEGEEAPDGLWDSERNRILLHVSLRKRPRYARQILLHELIHACCDLYHEVS